MMTAMRTALSLMTALSLFGVGCSSENPAPSPTGGTSGTTSTSGNAGTTTTGGGSGTTGAGGHGGASGNGGSAQSGGVTSTGGSAQSGTGGMTSTGGSTSAGSGGADNGGGSGTAGVGGVAAGASGSGGLGGAGATGGSGAGGSSAGSGGGGDAEQSAGCGEPRTLQNGTIDIMFNGASRKYILRVPDDYDNEHPYRLVFAYAESGASAMSVADRDYFRFASLDSMNTTIFVAPDAANGAGSWSKSDVELTDAILEELEADLCIDKTRIFATGFSFGGAMSLALACTRAHVFRGVAFFSGADLTGSCTETLTQPIAYYASQASGDSSGDPMPSSGRVKQAQFAEVNGCTPEPDATTFPAPGEPHKCTVYQGCSEGHPTVYCVFEGPHGWEPRDPGESMSWNAPEAWKFITQF